MLAVQPSAAATTGGVGGDTPIEDADADQGDISGGAAASAVEPRTDVVATASPRTDAVANVAAVQIDKQPHATGQPLPSVVLAEPDGKVASDNGALAKPIVTSDVENENPAADDLAATDTDIVEQVAAPIAANAAAEDAGTNPASCNQL